MTNNPNEWLKRYEAELAERRSAAAEAKVKILERLAALNVALVTVDYDGCGDSGQIDDVSGWQSINEPDGEGNNEIVLDHQLKADIEEMCYNFLEGSHDGWGNNEGAFGEFRIDVKSGTITLNHHERVEETVDSTDTF